MTNKNCFLKKIKIISINLPMNPARGGNPAMDSNVTIKVKVIKGKLPIPFSSFKDLKILRSNKKSSKTIIVNNNK